MPLTTAYRQQCFADNPHLLTHEYRLVLLTHLGATPVRLQRVATLATRSPAGTSALGESVSAAAEVVGTGYTAGGLPVTVTVDVVGETPRLLFTSALWQSITADIRGAVLYNKTLEDLGSTSILGWLDAAELITRTAEPLRVSVLDGVFAVLPPEGETGTVGTLVGDAATAAASASAGTLILPPVLTGSAPSAAASVTAGTLSVPSTGLGALDSQLAGLGSGWSLATDNEHTTLSPSGWSIFNGGGDPNNGSVAPQIVTESGIPGGDTSAIEYSYAGVVDGYEPQKSYFGFTNSTELYFAQYVKFDASWTWPPSSGFKMWIIGEGGPFFGWIGSGRYTAAPYNNANAGVGRFAYDSNGFAEVPFLITEPPILNGQWVKFIFYMKTTSTRRIALWINTGDGNGDQLVQDSAVNPGTDITVGNATVNELQFPATRGGGTPGPGLTNDRIRVARTLVYRK